MRKSWTPTVEWIDSRQHRLVNIKLAKRLDLIPFKKKDMLIT